VFTGYGGGRPKALASGAPAAVQPAGEPRVAATPADQADAPLPPPAFESALPNGVQAIVFKPFTGDLDEMVKRRLIRLGVTYNRTFYFVDKGAQRGAVYEYGKLFEEDLNKTLNTGNMKVDVAFVPLPRDMLATGLLTGKVDAVIAQITITPDKQKLLDFTNPTRRNIGEVVVTGPGSPKIASVADLSGQEVFVRKGGTYHQSVLALNDTLRAQGKPPVLVRFAPDNLEDDDLLEMVNAGLVPITIVDSYLEDFWKKIFTNLRVHDTVTVRTGGELAVAIRKNSPQLAAAFNQFLAKNGLGTAFGNIMEKRYLGSTSLERNAASEAERTKFMALVGLFQKYSDEFQMDYLLMGAQGFQESGLNQDMKSPVGAVGIMQVMPETAKRLNVPDIRQLEANKGGGEPAGSGAMRTSRDQGSGIGATPLTAGPCPHCLHYSGAIQRKREVARARTRDQQALADEGLWTKSRAPSAG
jgi:membrane-bound lytic murein transglycosylase MltF